jgi:hypothetical protein
VKKDAWELDNSNMSSIQLMQVALNKFETCRLEKAWNKPSHEEQEIVALRTQVEKFSKNKATDTANKDPNKERKGVMNRKWTSGMVKLQNLVNRQLGLSKARITIGANSTSAGLSMNLRTAKLPRKPPQKLLSLVMKSQPV